MSALPKRIVLATGNAGKIRELSGILSNFGLEVVGLDAFPEIGEIVEDGTTFEENSLIKSRTVAQHTGLVAVADDSGLEVDALDKAPGVYSARYSADITDNNPTTQANNDKLLSELKRLNKLRPEERTARFRCVMSAVAPNGEFITADGSWEGQINLEPEGDNGFGYDPLFFDPELGRTSATLTKEEKHSRSHRGKALEALLKNWPDFWAKADKL